MLSWWDFMGNGAGLKLEDQVCSLELAKKLKELGIGLANESYFCYYKLKDADEYGLSEKWQIDDPERFNEINAFTVAELGAMLPDCLYTQTASGYDKPLILNKVDGIYSVGILNPNQTIFPRFSYPNEADARAMMLIYLIETGEIKI